MTNWVGVTGGWALLANWIAVPMYRAGMYTNAEYLEARFDLSTRVVSALVQALYRTLVLGIIATTLYLVLSIVGGWERPRGGEWSRLRPLRPRTPPSAAYAPSR